MFSSSSSSKPSPFRSSIPSILLLTIITSLAFNNSLLSSHKQQNFNRFQIQQSVLLDIFTYKKSKLDNEDLEKNLSNRCRSVGLFPKKYHLHQQQQQEQEQQEISWSQILFGKEKGSLSDRWKVVVNGIQNSFNGIRIVEKENSNDSNQEWNQVLQLLENEQQEQEQGQTTTNHVTR